MLHALLLLSLLAAVSAADPREQFCQSKPIGGAYCTGSTFIRCGDDKSFQGELPCEGWFNMPQGSQIKCIEWKYAHAKCQVELPVAGLCNGKAPGVHCVGTAGNEYVRCPESIKSTCAGSSISTPTGSLQLVGKCGGNPGQATCRTEFTSGQCQGKGTGEYCNSDRSGFYFCYDNGGMGTARCVGSCVTTGEDTIDCRPNAPGPCDGKSAGRYCLDHVSFVSCPDGAVKACPKKDWLGKTIQSSCNNSGPSDIACLSFN